MSEVKDPLVGMTIREYVLIRFIGRGAMGMVYLAQHQSTGQKVAIKFLSGDFAMKKEFVDRFINEAAACAAFDHENIIRVYEAGQEDGVHFMVMEYIEGVDLAHFLKVQDKVKESQVIPWIKQSARALSYAHSRGIVHRDLKPENIMLTHGGIVKIADLGLSKKLETEDHLSMTMSGTVIGTPYYISPEQAKNAKRVDIRTDIYSLGATFYHLVTGSPPFGGDSAAEVMSKHMNELLVNPQRKNSALSDGLSDLIMKMMEKDPSKRFQTMEELIEALERLEKGKPVIIQKLRLVRSHMIHPKVVELTQSNRNTVWILGVSVALVLIMVGFFILRSWKSSFPKEVKDSIVVSDHKESVTATPLSQESKIQEADGKNLLGNQASVHTTASQNSEQKKSSSIGAEEQSLQFEGEVHKRPLAKSISNSLNWLDGIAVFTIFFGVPAARRVGFLWGTVRAIAIWIAVLLVCHWFGDLASWFQDALALPKQLSGQFAFVILSVITILPGWVSTNRLIGSEKETWKYKLNHMLAVFPGLVLGGALVVWFLTLIIISAPDALPIHHSWIGSRILTDFPAVQGFVDVLK